MCETTSPPISPFGSTCRWCTMPTSIQPMTSAITARDENDAVRQKRMVANSFFHCGDGGWVAEFAAQRCYGFGIGDIDGTYLNIHAPTLAWV